MSQPESTIRNEATSIPHWYDPSSDVLTVTEGVGSRVWDEEGNEYLDFCSQLYCANLGYDEESVIEAMVEQARQIPYDDIDHKTTENQREYIRNNREE